MEDAALRNEKRLSELERQIDLLKRENSLLKRRLEVLSLPAHQAMEAYLEEKGLSGVPLKDADGAPLERKLRTIRLASGLEVRYESRDNMSDLDAGAEDAGDFILNRLRLALGFDCNPNVTLGLDLRATYVGGGFAGLNEPGAGNLEDIDGLYVHEAYALFKDVNLLGRFGGHIPVSIQVGRQEMAYGDGFIMGADKFGRGISYDAIRFIQAGGNHRLDLFWAKLLENDFQYSGGVITPTTSPDSDADLVGLYFSYLPVADTALDAYVLYLSARGGATPSPYAGYPEARLSTFGLRATGSSAAVFTYSLEGAVQAGHWLTEDVTNAFALLGRARFEAAGRAGKPAIECVAAYASGDRAPLDGELNRFMPLAQEQHDLFGGLDLLTTSNLKAIGARVASKPLPELRLFAGYYHYYAVELADAAGGFVPSGGTGNDVGWEWNIGLDWEISPRSRLECMYGEYQPGDFTGYNGAAKRLYLSLEVAF